MDRGAPVRAELPEAESTPLFIIYRCSICWFSGKRSISWRRFAGVGIFDGLPALRSRFYVSYDSSDSSSTP